MRKNYVNPTSVNTKNSIPELKQLIKDAEEIISAYPPGVQRDKIDICINNLKEKVKNSEDVL